MSVWFGRDDRHKQLRGHSLSLTYHLHYHYNYHYTTHIHPIAQSKSKHGVCGTDQGRSHMHPHTHPLPISPHQDFSTEPTGVIVEQEVHPWRRGRDTYDTPSSHLVLTPCPYVWGRTRVGRIEVWAGGVGKREKDGAAARVTLCTKYISSTWVRHEVRSLETILILEMCNVCLYLQGPKVHQDLGMRGVVYGGFCITRCTF